MPRVDDTSSAISYSRNWQSSSGISQQYESGTRFTTSPGATATIKFRGTSIKVYGTNPAGSGDIEAVFVIDNQSNSWNRGSHHIPYYQDFFWETGRLSDTEHTLVVTNTGSTIPFHLDFFDIEGSAVTPLPSAQPSTSASKPGVPAISRSSSTPALSSRVTEASSSRGQLESASGSTSSTSVSSTSDSTSLAVPSGNSSSFNDSASTSAGSVTITAFQVVTTSISGGSVGVVTQVPDQTSGTSSNGGRNSTSPSIGAIAGIVFGALVLLLLVGIFAVLLYRRHQRDKNDNESSEALGGVDSPGLSQYRISRLPTVSTFEKGAVLSRGASDSRRPFHQLSDNNANIYEGTVGTGIQPPPSLSLDFPNEKLDITSTSATHADSFDSPDTTSGSRISGIAYSYVTAERPPPAYTLGRQSAFLSSRDTNLAEQQS